MAARRRRRSLAVVLQVVRQALARHARGPGAGQRRQGDHVAAAVLGAGGVAGVYGRGPAAVASGEFRRQCGPRAGRRGGGGVVVLAGSDGGFSLVRGTWRGLS